MLASLQPNHCYGYHMSTMAKVTVSPTQKGFTAAFKCIRHSQNFKVCTWPTCSMKGNRMMMTFHVIIQQRRYDNIYIIIDRKCSLFALSMKILSESPLSQTVNVQYLSLNRTGLC